MDYTACFSVLKEICSYFLQAAAVHNTQKLSIFEDDEASQDQKQSKANVVKPKEEAAKTSLEIEDASPMDVDNLTDDENQEQSTTIFLTPREEAERTSFEIEDASLMVVDDLTEETNSITSLSELNRHLESILPEIYRDDLYKYLRDCEKRHRPKPHYMSQQPYFTLIIRQRLIGWLVLVADYYSINNETLFLAVSLIDRFLSRMLVSRENLQLVGVTAMLIASKYEESYHPKVQHFIYITKEAYSKKQILRMECLILEVLDFELAVPTPHYFLQLVAQLSRPNEATFHLATYLCELTLMETQYLHYPPSLLAASCVALASLSSGREIWSSCMCASTGYTLEQLMSCIKDLHNSWSRAPVAPQHAIREKYKCYKWHAVSLMTPPPLSKLES